MKVLKFGGTSVGSSQNIKKIIEIINSKPKEAQIVVVSAFAKVTNLLLESAQLASIKKSAYISVIEDIKHIHLNIISALFSGEEKEALNTYVNQKLKDLSEVLHGISLISELSAKSEATIVSYGEQLSSYIINKALLANGISSVRVDTRTLIKTNNNYTSATVNFDVSNQNIQNHFKTNTTQVTVLPGFIATGESGNTTVLGRGGSDYTAAIIAAALDVDTLEIWTDVSGMYTANPTLVKQATPIEQISYEEAMELSHFGAKVIYPPTIHPVLRKEIPIHIFIQLLLMSDRVRCGIYPPCKWYRRSREHCAVLAAIPEHRRAKSLAGSCCRFKNGLRERT